MAGEIESVAKVKMQRRFAIGPRPEFDPAHVEFQFDVVIDFTVGDQGRFSSPCPGPGGPGGHSRCPEASPRLFFSSILGGKKGLVAGFQVDDGKAGLCQAGTPGNHSALPVRTPVGQGGGKRL